MTSAASLVQTRFAALVPCVDESANGLDELLLVFTVATEGACELGDVTSCNVWTASATIPLGT